MERKLSKVLCSVLTVFCAITWGQTVSSTVLGILTDPSGAVVPGVQVQLMADATGEVRTGVSNAGGLFRILDLTPGTYTLTVKSPAFKTLITKGINLASSETRDLGRVALELGNVSEEVSVTATSTPVQTASSEKSALVDSAELSSVTLKGRDLFGFMDTLPGLVDTTVTRDVTAPGAIAGISINGNPSGKQDFTVDGITDMDVGSNTTVGYEQNMDSIGEIRVLTSNYQAEFGRNAGGTISVITKSGTREFHGSGWWNHRHEEFNANSFFNNRSGLPRTLYRYNVEGFSLGGPLVIPHALNTKKNRLFFFVSQEYTRQLVPSAAHKYQLPTALERSGDFSQSLGTNGALITIKDPTTGAPFPGNKIPSTRFNAVGSETFLSKTGVCSLK